MSRFAIDAAFVGTNRSGNEVYTRGMIRGLGDVLAPEVTIGLAGHDLETLAAVDAGRHQVEVVPTPSGALGELTLGRVLNRWGSDVLLASYNAPVGSKATVATVIHDLAFQRVPETFPWSLRWRLELSVARSVRVSDFVVTVSEFSRNELLTRAASMRRAMFLRSL